MRSSDTFGFTSMEMAGRVSAHHMASSSDRTIYARRKDVTREQRKAISLSIIAQRPLVADVVEEAGELSYVYGLGRCRRHFLGSHAIDVVPV